MFLIVGGKFTRLFSDNKVARLFSFFLKDDKRLKEYKDKYLTLLVITNYVKEDNCESRY
ncbi:hypothetical protein SDC9_99570 [bioreactor metagenome]|uniref:Uncharacterized protein n=2 Tax=root TaxID=1 RepID=A0A069CXH5_9BACE|nr:hypothetical protein JCM15093_374 [Bacteroides graminisolvens DSM 19988 = JCM 15093]